MNRRSRPGSISMILPSLTATILVSVGMDVILLGRGDRGCSDCLGPGALPAVILTGALLINATTLLQALTGALIEWRRPGHLIGRLLMISGPLYALLAAGWFTGDTLGAFVDPAAYRILNWAGAMLSWPGVALIAGWLPLLFPSGSLPGPRWRLPAVAIAGIGTAGVLAIAVRPGEIVVGSGFESPFAIGSWSPLIQPIRRRTQAAVDQRFNRARYDAERTIDALAARLPDEMDRPVVRSAVVDAVAHSVEPTAASLWLRPGRAR